MADLLDPNNPPETSLIIPFSDGAFDDSMHFYNHLKDRKIAKRTSSGHVPLWLSPATDQSEFDFQRKTIRKFAPWIEDFVPILRYRFSRFWQFPSLFAVDCWVLKSIKANVFQQVNDA